jgi:hypothetical protein
MAAMETDKTIAPVQFHKWWPWLVGLGTVWGLIVMVIIAITEPTNENIALAVSIWFAGAYTLAQRITRRFWLPLCSRKPMRAAIILGVVNAALIETEFLIFGHIFDAVSIAAHPNLIMDLLMTMPWYILMVITFAQVQKRWRFRMATVLFLGGIYEVGGDGMVGALFSMMDGNFQLLTLAYWLLMAFVYVWAFIPVYSSMVLPAAWIIENRQPDEARPQGRAWRSALKPMLWLIPFTGYLCVLMLITMFISGE